MRNRMVKKIGLFFLLFTIALISGCETISAIRTGNITTDDIINIVRLKNTNTDTEKIEGTQKKNTVLENMEKADAWLKKNLW